MATNILGLMDYVQKQGDAGRKQGQEALFNRLAGQAYTAPAAQQGALVGQMVGVDPQAGMAVGSALAGRNQAAETDHMKKLGGAARYMASALQTKNPAQIEGAYQAVRPYLAQVSGKEPPMQWDPAMEPALYQAIAATGGTPEVKGTVVAPGGALVDSATGNPMFSNPAAPANVQLVDIPDGRGGTVKMLLDPKTRQLSQPNYGGGQSTGNGAQPPAQGGPAITPTSPAIPNAAAMANTLLDHGLSAEQAAAAVNASGGGLGKFALAVDPATGRFKDVSDGSAQFPQGQPATGGMGYAPPKGDGADTFRSATPDELKQYGLPDSAVAQVNTKTGKLDVISKPAMLSPDKMADVAVKRQKVEQAKQESVATFNDSITKIDTLLNDKSFGSLGTFTGDIAAKIPHTDTANAHAALDTISAQSVINVLSSLKSLSANGASGFGALSEKEGEILRNASANLSTSQDNAAIKRNLLDLRQKLVRSRDRISAQEIKLPEDSVGQQGTQPQQSGVDSLLSKYGVH